MTAQSDVIQTVSTRAYGRAIGRAVACKAISPEVARVATMIRGNGELDIAGVLQNRRSSDRQTTAEATARLIEVGLVERRGDALIRSIPARWSDTAGRLAGWPAGAAKAEAKSKRAATDQAAAPHGQGATSAAILREFYRVRDHYPEIGRPARQALAHIMREGTVPTIRELADALHTNQTSAGIIVAALARTNLIPASSSGHYKDNHNDLIAAA